MYHHLVDLYLIFQFTALGPKKSCPGDHMYYILVGLLRENIKTSSYLKPHHLVYQVCSKYTPSILLVFFFTTVLTWIFTIFRFFYFHFIFAITQIRLYICTGDSKFFTVYSMSGNFSLAGSIVFVFSVYNVVYCNNAHSKLKL